MEHLLFSSDGKPLELRYVPYLGHPYDRGSLFDYPVRAKRPELDIFNIGNYRVIAPNYQGIYAFRLERLFQTWLFFGLLHAFFGDAFDESDFTRFAGPEGSSQIVITTARLIPMLDEWYAEHGGRLSIEETERLALCFRLVHFYLSYTKDISFDAQMRLSIVSVAELLEFTMYLITQDTEHVPKTARGQFWNTFAFKYMQNTGWCPFEADVTLRRTDFVSSTFFFGCLKKTRARAAHSGCSRDHCIRSEIAFERLQREGMIHLDSCHGCLSVGIDAVEMKLMVELLQKQTVPLIRATRRYDDRIQFKVVPYDPKIRYVAISHVWCDGLGNPDENAIRTCQTDRLLQVTDHLQAQRRPGLTESDDQYLWIDTLCCPVHNKSARAGAISLMRETYRKADVVLVLDAELQKIRAGDIDILESMARVVSSGWMRRLWTFQEEALAGDLWIQFADGPKDLRVLAREIRSVTSAPYTAHNSCRVLVAMGMYRELRRYANIDQSIWNLRSVTRGIQDRLVTKPDDEPLCIGSLLDLDNRAIANASGQERFCVMWNQIESTHGIPNRVIFGQGTRLNIPGYAWAPRSIRDRNNEGSMHDDDQKPPAKIVSRGLRVTFPGAVLTPPKPPPEIDVRRLRELPSSHFDVMYLRDANGRWAILESFKDEPQIRDLLQIEKEDRQWVLILEAQIPKDNIVSGNFCSGILGSVAQSEPELTRINKRSTVSLNLLDEDMSSILNACYATAKQFYITPAWAEARARGYSLEDFSDDLTSHIREAGQKRFDDDEGLRLALERRGHQAAFGRNVFTTVFYLMLQGNYTLADSAFATDSVWDFEA